MPYNNIFDTTSYVRKCTLLTGPTPNRLSGAPSALGTDNRGSQINIDLSYLPPGVVLSQIHQGQKWWVEKRTTSWVLYLYVGEFNPYSYSLFTSTSTWVPDATVFSYNTIVYDTASVVIPSSMGPIISDPTSGILSVPIPGLYDVTVSAKVQAKTTTKQLGLKIVQPSSGFAECGPWSPIGTGTGLSDAYPVAQQSATVPLTEGNLSFFVKAAWAGGSVNIDTSDASKTYLSIVYRGPVN